MRTGTHIFNIIMALRLPLFMTVTGFFPKSRQNSRKDSDLEKAQRGVNDGINGQSDPPEEDDDPLSPRSGRRLRRLSSATQSTFFSNPVNHHAIHKSEMSNASWRSKLKSYIFPSDENVDDIEDFVPNYRWTPIFSGILIPFSILLDIPGLTERWYIKTVDNTITDTKPNPVILDVGMALSLSCAVIANICLICRFLEKRVKTFTLLCILFLTAHGRPFVLIVCNCKLRMSVLDIINITTVTVFGIEHRFDDGFTYGDSFWVTVCSTIASTITNVTLIIDYVKTPDFARSGKFAM